MRTTLLIVPLIMVGALANGQGTISFVNTPTVSTKISVETTPGGTSTLTSGPAGTYDYALYYSKTSSTVNGTSGPIVPTGGNLGDFVPFDSNWTFSGAYAVNSTILGRISGGNEEVVTGVGAGESANFAILGWSSNIGTTVAAVTAWLSNPTTVSGGPVYVGESAVSTMILGGGSVPPPTAVSVSYIPGFVLVDPAPEPSALALVTCGWLMLVAIRRRQG